MQHLLLKTAIANYLATVVAAGTRGEFANPPCTDKIFPQIQENCKILKIQKCLWKFWMQHSRICKFVLCPSRDLSGDGNGHGGF